jgi:hypothetical protein
MELASGADDDRLRAGILNYVGMHDGARDTTLPTEWWSNLATPATGSFDGLVMTEPPA